MLVETYSATSEYSARETAVRTDDLLAFDVRLYYRLYHEALIQTQDHDQASQILETAVSNDSVGLISEKVSSERVRGGYLFSAQDRVSLQMTPARHIYYQVKDGQTGEERMVSPEMMEIEKDILRSVSGWRRGLDLRVISLVKESFFQGQIGQTYTWGSARAQSWEEIQVRACQGEYGWIYRGAVEEFSQEDEKFLRQKGDRLVRKMVVHDYKFAGDAQVLDYFLRNSADQLIVEGQDEDKFLDQVMTTVAVSNRFWSDEETFQKLSDSQAKVTRDGRIFNLPLDVILALQDVKLKARLRNFVRQGVTRWLVSHVKQNTTPEVVQQMVRAVYIRETKEFLDQYKLSKITEAGERFYIGLNGYNLANYSGSSGDFCGKWGPDKTANGHKRQEPHLVKFRSRDQRRSDEEDRKYFIQKGYQPDDGVCQDCGYEGVVADCDICRLCNEDYDEYGYNPRRQGYQLAA